MKYELLALDLDGTLLDPYGDLTPSARGAVAGARRAGLEVVVCTGRRYRSTLPVLEALALEGCVVVNNGAVVKQIGPAQTLHHHYLEAELYPELLAFLRRACTPLVYVDRYHEGFDMLTDAQGETHPFQAEYLADHEAHLRRVADLAAAPPEHLIMLSTMGEPERLEALRRAAHAEFGERIATHRIANKNYRGQILEFFSPRSGKWAGLQRVAERLGVEPARIAAVGDDFNDLELLREAGLGIAMGNAHAEVRAAADRVVRSNAEGGVVEAIEAILAER